MKPARRIDSCQTPVRNSTPPSTSAPNPPKKTSELTSARATARCRMTAGSRIGFGWRNERTTSQAPDTAAMANPPTIRALSQPQSVPSTMAATRLATDTESSAAPSRSALCAAGSRTSRSMRIPKTRASTLKGRLTRNTHRQLTCTRSPPIGGPKAAAAPPTADHSPMAAPLRPGPKAGSSSPRDVGSMSAPPVACSTRAAIRNPSEGAIAQSAEEAVKIARPMRKAFLRPARSAQRPAGTSAAANTIV